MLVQIIIELKQNSLVYCLQILPGYKMLGTHVEPSAMIMNVEGWNLCLKLIEVDETNNNVIDHGKKRKAYSFDHFMQHLSFCFSTGKPEKGF